MYEERILGEPLGAVGITWTARYWFWFTSMDLCALCSPFRSISFELVEKTHDGSTGKLLSWQWVDCRCFNESCLMEQFLSAQLRIGKSISIWSSGISHSYQLLACFSTRIISCSFVKLSDASYECITRVQMGYRVLNESLLLDISAGRWKQSPTNLWTAL